MNKPVSMSSGKMTVVPQRMQALVLHQGTDAWLIESGVVQTCGVAFLRGDNPTNAYAEMKTRRLVAARAFGFFFTADGAPLAAYNLLSLRLESALPLNMVAQRLNAQLKKAVRTLKSVMALNGALVVVGQRSELDHDAGVSILLPRVQRLCSDVRSHESHVVHAWSQAVGRLVAALNTPEVRLDKLQTRAVWGVRN